MICTASIWPNSADLAMKCQIIQRNALHPKMQLTFYQTAKEH